MIRAFLALPLPDDIRATLTVQQFLLPLPRQTDPAQFHLTLVFLGDCTNPMLEAAHDGFVPLRAPGLTLTLNGLGLFGGAKPRVAWAGIAPNDALIRLQARAERQARLAGCPLDSRRFTPHITLGRFPPPPPPDAMRLERAIALTPLTSRAFPVTEMVLYRSTLHPKGPRHDELARYPLEGP